MKKIIAALTILVASSAYAVTGFYTGEKISGMHKICYYNALGDTVAITISSVELCPLTIEI